MDTTKSFNIRLLKIEITEKSLVLSPPYPNSPEKLSNFAVNLKANTTIDKDRKQVSIYLHMDVKNLNGENLKGKLHIGYDFEIINFDDIPKNEKGQYSVPKELEDILRNIAISTARGVMFSEFRGTLLDNAILPIVEAGIMKETMETS